MKVKEILEVAPCGQKFCIYASEGEAVTLAAETYTQIEYYKELLEEEVLRIGAAINEYDEPIIYCLTTKRRGK